MSLMFNESGCEKCRTEWAYPFIKNLERVLTKAGATNYSRQSTLYQCSKCLNYWEDTNGSYPHGLTKEEAKEFYGLTNT